MAYEYRENEINLFHSKGEGMPLLRTCQHAVYRQTRFIWLRHFQDTLSSKRRKKLTEKTENNRVEDRILSLCISIKEIYLLDPRLPFQKTKLINGVHWSSFHIMALTESCHLRLKAPFEINTFESFRFRCHWQDVIVAASQRGPEGSMSSPSWVRRGVSGR